MVQDRVIGILDWELSTLGNQMSDVAYSCLVSSPFFPSSLLRVFISTLWCRFCNILLNRIIGEEFIFLLPKLIASFIFFWQAYIVDTNLDNQQLGKGFELTGIPEGIPSQAEYLAEYCSASVRSNLKLWFNCVGF